MGAVSGGPCLLWSRRKDRRAPGGSYSMHMGGPAPAWEGHGSCLQGRAAGSRARVSKALGKSFMLPWLPPQSR